MENFIIYFKALHPTTLLSLTMLVMAGSYLVYVFFDSRWLTLLFGAAFFAGAIGMHYAVTMADLDLTNDRDIDLMIVGCAGMLAALLLMLAIYRLVSAATRVRKHDMPKTRVHNI
ncbi:MAG: hypothetical protein ACK4MF_05860 [Hyphomicrobiaceae bacterium]